MRKPLVALTVLVLLAPAVAAAQTTRLRVAISARTISMGVGSPFAVAMKMGWFKQEGVEIEIVPLPGSTDCVKAAATGEVPVSLPSVEPLANGRPQGVKAKIFYTAYQTKPTGKDEATAVREDMKVLEARMPHFKLEPAGVKRWGENSEANYREYVDFLAKWSVITQKVPTADLITNEMIEEINRMDAAKIAAEAAAYRYAR